MPMPIPDRNAQRALAPNPVRCAALTFCLVLITAGTAAAQTAPPYKLGVYVGDPDISDQSVEAGFDANYASFASAMNAQAMYYNINVDFTQPIDQWASNAGYDAASRVASPVASQLQPLLGFPMYSIAYGAPAADQQFQAFAAGQYDDVINTIVQNWVQTGGVTNQIWRVGWEMNLPYGPYFVGGYGQATATPQAEADWVAAFKHIVGVFKQAGMTYGANITIVWNPGTTNYSSAHATGSLYPGDKYVDSVGIDMYADMAPYSDTPYPNYTYHDWDTGGEDTSVAQFIADPINRHHYWTWPAATAYSLNGSGGNAESFKMLEHFAMKHAKPLAVCETGAGDSNDGTDVNDDPTFPLWLSQELKRFVNEGGSVSFVSIWDSNATGQNYEFSMPSDDKPLEEAEWRKKFGD